MEFATSIAPFLVAGVVSVAMTPVAGRLARRFGIFDCPSQRKVNQRLGIPLLGGLAVAAGVAAGLATAWASPGTREFFPQDRTLGLLLGGLVMFAVGLCDDRFTLSAWAKLPFQIAAAAVAISYGYRIESLTDPISGTVWYLDETLVWLITGLWIVGITNAINLMDGLDGLATGLAAIIVLTLTWICFRAEEPFGTLMGLALAGALLGFLPFNFAPARIFLGDTGALFIGFTLSLVALEGYRKLALLSFVVPLLALAVPLLDTSLSVLRRIRDRSSILKPDRLHMHHRLLESQGSQQAAVLSIYFLTACFCVIAVSFTRLQGFSALLFLAIVVLLTLRLLRNLGLFRPPAGAQGMDVEVGDEQRGGSTQ